MSELSEFRAETRAWLAENLPERVVGRGDGFAGGTKAGPQSADHRRWFEACYERGFTVPSWPTAYGGAGLDPAFGPGRFAKRWPPHARQHRLAAWV